MYDKGIFFKTWILIYYTFFIIRYQCLKCINYDLCQDCFFYDLFSQSHKTSHPMQEFTYKSTRKEATRALLKVVVNNFKNNKIFKRNKFRFRYLPHDPQMVLENTFNETIDELPVTVEALNLPPIPANDYGSGIIILLDFEMNILFITCPKTNSESTNPEFFHNFYLCLFFL